DETNTNHWIQLPFKKPLNEILDELYKRNVISLFVEGGQQLLQSFLDAKLWDEARVFTSSAKLQTGVQAPTIDRPLHHSKFISSDNLDFYYND
ncbi:dihydrofolate reductase family protein, partial [Flavobacteriales bacterium]|nr:dihydrofolate reductase family protein [Flavobacteriales bacterium]